MIRLHAADVRSLTDFARACLPAEACGLLAGTEADGVRDVQKVYLLTNTDHASDHFSLDPREQLQAVRDMRAHGWKPLGNWHSHPASPSRPSQEDVRLAYDPDASYLILSLQADVPNLNAFRIRGGNYEWEILEIHD